MIGKIIGTGAYIPPVVWDNNKLAEMVDTSDEWIRERTGIGSRHISLEKGACEMAVEAAKKAIDDCVQRNPEFDVAAIDAIIVCSTTTNMTVPSMACVVQKEIGATNAFAFDLNSACSGFVFSYNTILGYMNLGIVKNALIVGAEQLSGMIDFTDRGSCILFGDAAGAVVVTAVAGDCRVKMHSDGAQGEVLYCKLGDKLEMDGQRVFRFAAKQVPEVVSELMEDMQITDDDVDYYIFHQANLRIIEAAVKRLKISMEKVPINIEYMGNTSTASIPVLLDELRKKGTLTEDKKVIMAGFGAGLTWGASYIIS